jgi:hypothetical protein
MSDCPICLNTLPEEPVEQITCPSCNETVCNTCFESYLLSKDEAVIFCHSCEKPWSEDFIDENSYDDFRNGQLRQHRTKISVDQEEARLPALQDRARRYAIADGTKTKGRSWHVRAMIDSYGAPISLRAVEHTEPCFFCNHDTECPGGPVGINDNYCHRCYNHKSVFGNCPILPRAARYAKEKEEVELLFGPGSCSGSVAPPKRVFRACPLDRCRGFLDETGKCGMCEEQVCLKCHEVLPSKAGLSHSAGSANHEVLVSSTESPHICDPATVATVKLLARETKPCPNCHASIYKIDGCDQMWCTQCQTPFSWLTGLKEEGRVHNPHYYEWMRRTQGSVPRETGDAPCRDGQLRDLIIPEGTDKYLAALLIGVHRCVAEHLQYNQPPPPNEEQLNRIGIKYLIGVISKQEWARRVYIEKRQQKRLQGQYDIVRAFASAATDLFNAMEEPKQVAKALADLMVYMEESLTNLYGRYFYTGAGICIIPNWDKITASIWYDRLAFLSKICGREIKRVTDIDVTAFTKYVDWTLSAK